MGTESIHPNKFESIYELHVISLILQICLSFMCLQMNDASTSAGVVQVCFLNFLRIVESSIMQNGALTGLFCIHII